MDIISLKGLKSLKGLLTQKKAQTLETASDPDSPLAPSFRNALYLVGIFIILVFIQIIHNITLFNKDFIELADFASNSILVEDAKQFKLLHGHYSRIGFYHPGPLIFYFQALGEWLIYDIYHLAKSPFAGQIFGLFIFIALLLTLSLHCLKLLLNKWQPAFFLASFILILNINLFPTNLSSPWFPHLYAIIFLPFTLAWTALHLNKITALPIFSFSSILLFHGHIAFTIFVAVAWIFVFICIKKAALSNRISVRDYILIHSNIMWISLGIILIGVLPILFHTLLHFPGEIIKYLAYSPNISGHTWSEALKFTVFYWIHSTEYPDSTKINYTIFILIILTYTVVVINKQKTENIITSNLGQEIAITTSIITILTLLYTRYKVDDWSDHYTIIFYSSSILLIVSIACAMIVALFLDTKKLWKSALILILISLSTWPKYSVYSIERPVIEPVLNAIESKSLVGPVEIEVDHYSESFSKVWIYLVAILMDTNRRGYKNICVTESTWTLAYHARTKCDPVEKRLKIYIGLSSHAKDKNVLAAINDIVIWD